MSQTFSQRVFKLQRDAAPYVFVAPFIIGFALFGLYPLIKSLILAFYITNGPQQQVFAGFDNFRFLFADRDFHRAVWNTLVFTFFSIVLQMPISLALALLLNTSLVRGRNFFRFAFFSPHLFGQVFVAIMFGIIFLPKYGLLNRGLNAFSGFPIDTKWLQNPSLIMPALLMTSLWMSVGFNMIYCLAALQSIDRSLYEAASVDGANAWQRFLNVTLPGIKPVLIFILVIITIGSFQLYELPWVMLEGPGPEKAGLTIVMMLYIQGFQAGDLGYASAIGWSLAAMMMGVSLVQVLLSGALRSER